MAKFKWTKERVKLSAKKFSTISLFKHNAKGAYNAALQNNWIQDVTKHMKPINKKWDKKSIIELAKEYSNFAEFRRMEGSAYVTANKKGWLKEVILHMTSNIRWSDEMIINEAKKYQTRREFEKKAPSACTLARARNLMDLACAHMERVGSFTKRLVYVYEFPDKSVYVGLTYNKRLRHNDHISKPKSPVYKKIMQLGFVPEMKIISDSYIVADSARILEGNTIEFYKSNGWQILNSIKAGGLGGTKTKEEKIFFDKQSCQNEALKYATRKEFREGSPYAYRRAYVLDCLEDICSHMKSRSFSFEECKIEAKKYKSITEFLVNSPKYYSRAHRMGWITKICSHCKTYTKWSPVLVEEEAKKYYSRGEFSIKSRSAYEYARVNKLLNKVCSHMQSLLTYWDLASIKKEAAKAMSIKEFRTNCSKAYEAAIHNGWLDDVWQIIQEKNPSHPTRPCRQKKGK